MLTNLHLNFKDHIYDACCRVGKAKTLLKAHSERNKIILEEIVLKTVALTLKYLKLFKFLSYQVLYSFTCIEINCCNQIFMNV